MKSELWDIKSLFQASTLVLFTQIIFGECFSIYLRSRASLSYEYIVCVYKAVGCFVFGAALSQSLTDIAKYTIGRLRPHFLSVCKPHWSLVDCSSGYIQNFTCTGDPHVTNEGRRVKRTSFSDVLMQYHFVLSSALFDLEYKIMQFTNNDVQSSTYRLSFYSGHSSFSMYCMLFLAVSVFLWEYFIFQANRWSISLT